MSDKPEIFVSFRKITLSSICTLIIAGIVPIGLFIFLATFSEKSRSFLLLSGLLIVLTALFSSSYLFDVSSRVEISATDIIFSSIFGRQHLPIADVESIVPIKGRYGGVIGMRVRGHGVTIQLSMGGLGWGQVQQICDSIMAKAATLSVKVSTEEWLLDEKSFNIGVSVYIAAVVVFMSGLILLLVRHAYLMRHP